MARFSFFKSKGGAKGKKGAEGDGGPVAPPKPRWEESWTRKEVAPAEIQELIHFCTQEMKSRALDTPFVLLPFRPGSDTTAFAKVFVRSFFKAEYEGSSQYRGHNLQQELRLTEPPVLVSILKWCWSRIPNGVVSWDVYELFRAGELDSRMARNAFHTFIPLSVDSDARREIIFDFFDLLAAIAARGKTNGLGGRKLSRMAGWWAFEYSDEGKGFDGGYRSWTSAADAASHLFFAYLRSLSPDSLEGIGGIAALPRSLQALLSQTEYPPETPSLMQTTTKKVVMMVDSVSPTPFALLRRAKHFEYRDDDETLQQYSAYEDPVQALTDECRRVLGCISTTNQSAAPTNGNGQVAEGSWTRFEDMGFSSVSEDVVQTTFTGGLHSSAQSTNGDFGRPTTPSWADFLSTGFPDDKKNGGSGPMLLSPDKVLPPIGDVRGHSSQSHVRHGPGNQLEPGELASIASLDLDETFWWVWQTSLAGEETTERKAVFGRCALIETNIPGGRWLVMEEQVKGASPGPEEGAYIAEKKSRFSFTRRGRLGRRKSTGKKGREDPYDRNASTTPSSKIGIAPEQKAKVDAAAARLAQGQRDHNAMQSGRGRARLSEHESLKTNSVLTLQPVIVNEAAPAMKWAKEFDRDEIRANYLADRSAGKGHSTNGLLGVGGSSTNLPVSNSNGNLSISRSNSNRALPALPHEAGPRTPRKEVYSPPPPPVPAAPQTALQKKPAADVIETRLPNATSYDEKPNAEAEHPAYRVPSHQEDADFVATTTSSPESAKQKKTDPKKLKKELKAGGGFKKMFSRRGKDGPSRSTTPMPPTQEKPANDVKPARRMSLLRHKPAPVVARPKTPEDTPKVDTPFTEPTMSMPSESVSHSFATGSGMAHEEHDAEQAFSRFDQGPLDDVPVFLPDAESLSDRAPSPPPFRTRAAPEPEIASPPSPPMAPVVAPKVEPAPDNVSEASVELSREISPQDRWAQIRKNAAERAARGGGDEPPAPSARRSHSQSQQSAKTEDGETSGEETIESRVARIKARVAELTGNMDSNGNITTAARR